jgi:hypothetical protein
LELEIVALQIGRVGLDVGLEDPETWDHSGEQVTVSGVLDAASLDDVRALRQQLLGLVDNPDEPVVPVVWDQDSWVDGFYAVRGVNVPTVPASLVAKWFPFSVTLERAPFYAQPLVESLLTGPLYRANDHSYTNDGFFHALPTAAAAVRAAVGAGIGGPTVLASIEGDIDVREFASANEFGTISYVLSPADWYDGAARFEIDYAGTGSFRSVVGRQIIDMVAAYRWRISNGLFRVHLGGDDINFALGIERWTGSDWSAAKYFNIGYHDTGAIVPFATPDSLAVLRNDPAAVVIRVSMDANVFSYWGICDITLRRGAPFVELNVSTNGLNQAGVQFWGVGTSSAEAASSLTDAGGFAVGRDLVGIQATSNDGDGLKYVIGSPNTNSRDLTNGRLWLPSSAKRTSFLLGLAREADGALFDEPDELASRYMSPRSETVRLVEQ